MLIQSQRNPYISWEDKKVYTFFKGISLKVKIIAWLEFEFMYNNYPWPVEYTDCFSAEV